MKGNKKPKVLFILGGPGSGKGTQCSAIVEDFDFEHLSAGDLLRAERNDPNSTNGKLIQSYIAEGKIVPVEITVNLILTAMKASSKEFFLIDGFPRNEDNVDGWERVIGDQAQVLGCLFFDCPEDVMEARILERGKTSGRSDDNITSIKKRFKTYMRETMPIIDTFLDQGKCWKVDAAKAKNDVYKSVKQIIQNEILEVPKVLFVLGGPGAGKGTQCNKIVKNFPFAHLSAGDLLRKERSNPESEHGGLIQECISEGKIVPVEVTVKLILDAIKTSSKSLFLIDGFPRNQDNVDGWNHVVGDKAVVLGCLFYDCSEATMQSRLLRRGQTSGRTDDNQKSIMKRFRTYKQESVPIVDSFKRQGKCWTIKCDKSIEEVYAETEQVLSDDILKLPKVVFVLGGPGSGKGTQCKQIVRDFDFEHLSAGDLLREERNSPQSEHGQIIQDYIAEGKIVPVEITVNLILKAMRASSKSRFLIDGFPRNEDNIEGWKRIAGGKAKVEGCLFFDCPEAVLEERLLERGKTSGRTDDNLTSIRKRFETYRRETMPIIASFNKQGKCWKVESHGSVEEVYDQVKSIIKLNILSLPKVIFVLGGPGAGKGTQCTKLKEEFGFEHLSAGDLLRAEKKDPESLDGKLIHTCIQEGRIVPVEITVGLILKAMNRSKKDIFLIDGFPRNDDNVRGWNEVVGNKANVLGCLYFECPETVMEARLLERAKTSGRADDNLATIRKRFQGHLNDTMPIVRSYQKEGRCWEIKADRSVDSVYRDLRQTIQNEILPLSCKGKKTKRTCFPQGPSVRLIVAGIGTALVATACVHFLKREK